MTDKFEHIDDVFREGLKDLKQSPGEGAWENISQRLKGNNRKRRLIIMSRAAAIFAFVITIISGYFLSQQIQTDNQQLATETAPVIESVQQPVEKPATHNTDVAEVQNDDEKVSSTQQSAQNATAPSSDITVVQPEINSSVAAENEPASLDEGESIPPIDIAENMPENEISNNLPLNRLEASTDYIPEQDNIQLDSYVSDKPSHDQPVQDHGQTAHENYLDPFAIATNEQNKEKMRFQLAGVATPLYASVESEYNNADQLSGFSSSSDVQDPEINKNALSAYTAGIKVSMSKGKRLSFQTGIMYAKVDQSHQYEAIERISVSEANSSHNNSDQIIDQNRSSAPSRAGFEFTSSVDTEESTEAESAMFDQYVQTISDDIQYLEIPLSMRYTVVDRKLDVNVLGGLATNFLVSGQRETATGSGIESTSDITSSLERIKYSTHLGLGFEYPIYKQLVFVLEPTMKYYMNSLESIQQTKANPFTFGLYTGVNFAF